MKAKHWRKGRALGSFDAEGRRIEERTFPSINAAKRESRVLQGSAPGSRATRSHSLTGLAGRR